MKKAGSRIYTFLIFLFFTINICISDKSFFYFLSCAYQEVPAFHIWQFRCQPAHSPSDFKWDPANHFQSFRLPVNVISTEKLIRTLAGKHYFHMLRSFLCQKIKGNCGCIS